MNTKPLSRYGRTLLFLLVFTVPLRSLALFQIPGASLRVPDLVILLGMLVMLSEWLLRGARLRVNSMDGWLWLFVAFIGVSLLWSLDPAYGLIRTFKFVRSLAFYLLLVQALEQDFYQSARIIAAGMVGSFVYILPVLAKTFSGDSALDLRALAQVQLATSGALDALRTDALGGGTFAGTVNTLAMWANVGTFLLTGTGWWRAPQLRTRIGFWAGWVAVVAVQIITLSRGAWLGLAAGGLWWLWRMRGQVRISAWVYVAGIVVALLAIRWLSSRGLDRLILARIESTTEVESDGSITYRFLFWRGAIGAFSEHPIGGVGMGGGTVVAARNGYKDWFVHNVYIQILYELGVVGFIIWGIIVVRWIARAFGVPLRSLAWSDRVLMVSIQAVTVSLFAMGLTNADFTEFEFWIVMAIVAARPPMAVAGPGLPVHGAS